MKMHNWIFKNGSSLEIATELARLTSYPAERLAEAAAHIAVFKPHDIRIAMGNRVWADGSVTEVDSEEPAARLEVWMSTELGDQVITVDV